MAAAGGASSACPRSGSGCSTTRRALDAAWDLVKDWTAEERQALRDEVPRSGLATPFRRTTVLEIARADGEDCSCGTGGPGTHGRGRRRRDALPRICREILADGRSPADELIAKFNGEWGGKVERVFEDYAF